MAKESLRWAGLALVVAVVAGSAVRGADDKAAEDLKKIQGTWVPVGDDGPTSRWVFEGDKLTSNVGDDEYICKVTLDPKAAPHPSADFLVTKGPGETEGKTARAIYKLNGDTLTICVTRPGQGSRPTEFKRIEDEAYLFELKRAK